MKKTAEEQEKERGLSVLVPVCVFGACRATQSHALLSTHNRPSWSLIMVQSESIIKGRSADKQVYSVCSTGLHLSAPTFDNVKSVQLTCCCCCLCRFSAHLQTRPVIEFVYSILLFVYVCRLIGNHRLLKDKKVKYKKVNVMNIQQCSGSSTALQLWQIQRTVDRVMAASGNWVLVIKVVVAGGQATYK